MLLKKIFKMRLDKGIKKMVQIKAIKVPQEVVVP
jgi:hypothetical protein